VNYALIPRGGQITVIDGATTLSSRLSYVNGSILTGYQLSIDRSLLRYQMNFDDRLSG